MNEMDWTIIAVFSAFGNVALIAAIWLYHWQVRRLQDTLVFCARQVAKLQAEKVAHQRIILQLRRGRPS